MDELLDLAPCGFVSLDEQGTIVLINATLCQWLDYTVDELVGQPFETLLSAGGRVFYQTQLQPVLQVSGHVEEIYLSLRAHGGAEMPVLINAARRERAGRTRFDCVLVPMQQRDRYETELLEARRAAQEANAAKDDFLAVVSHELRTPLNAIMGWAQLVREGVDAETLDLAMDVIERSGRAQVQIIEDILDVARMRGGTLHIEERPVAFADLVREVVDSIAPAARNQELALSLEVDATAQGARVCGDRARLRQVMLNLLSNALKFTPRGGAINVRVAREGNRLRCAFSDDGQGIAPALLPRVFERFLQGDASSTRRANGLGLGLSLVHSLIEMHGGRIEAASPGEGQGATFTLWLPLWDDETGVKP